MNKLTTVEASAVRAASAALDRATDEVLTNFGSSADTGRWLRLCASIESREDFDAFPASTSAETAGVPVADVTPPSLHNRDIGNERPLAPAAGATSGRAR